ncbi:hypothetical protein GCM10025867_20220 [Frondihabitans sucicola]|uniref:SIS domain-containing protein n=1 Tax=Frondihabitans sucicola TaxID=1268041 RepID=A0ABN6XXX4_9MICO|nr:sugar isomerase [Frondihabitans sucicola]BDZ49781.1 hypothetical protein GCM10025867_20220 [Frondihabitans sucicola]
MTNKTTTEIQSQPDTWARAIAESSSNAAFFGLPGERVLFLGCGTSAFVAESLASLRERAGLGETDAAYASEWEPGRRYDRIVAITRSGTTTEILDALTAAGPEVARSAITAVADMPVSDLVDQNLVLDYADEESVVQTRFPTTLLAAARAVYGYDQGDLERSGRATLAAPLGVDVARFSHYVYLGSGWTYGLAQEAALKIREAAQAWSESYPSLDYRHGPIAVAGSRSLVTIFGPVDPSLVADVEATGATVRTDSLDPLIQLAQAQRIAVALAEHEGLDPDTPRGLTRSVVLGQPELG